MFRPGLRQPLSTQKHGEGDSGGEINTTDEGEGCGWRKGRRRWLLHHLQGEGLLRVEHHGDLVDQVDVCGAGAPLVHRQVGQVLAGMSKASRSSLWSPWLSWSPCSCSLCWSCLCKASPEEAAAEEFRIFKSGRDDKFETRWL